MEEKYIDLAQVVEKKKTKWPCIPLRREALIITKRRKESRKSGEKIEKRDGGKRRKVRKDVPRADNKHHGTSEIVLGWVCMQDTRMQKERVMSVNWFAILKIPLGPVRGIAIGIRGKNSTGYDV